jgi:hypothetical protein
VQDILLGFGSLKKTFGRIVFLSNDKAHLMMLVIPEAPSE